MQHSYWKTHDPWIYIEKQSYCILLDTSISQSIDLMIQCAIYFLSVHHLPSTLSFILSYAELAEKKGTPRNKQTSVAAGRNQWCKIEYKVCEGHSIVCDNYNFNYSSRITFICRSNLLPAQGEISKFLFTYAAGHMVSLETLCCG